MPEHGKSDEAAEQAARARENKKFQQRAAKLREEQAENNRKIKNIRKRSKWF
jgi:hypothetical protein